MTPHPTAAEARAYTAGYRGEIAPPGPESGESRAWLRGAQDAGFRISLDNLRDGRAFRLTDKTVDEGRKTERVLHGYVDAGAEEVDELECARVGRVVALT